MTGGRAQYPQVCQAKGERRPGGRPRLSPRGPARPRAWIENGSRHRHQQRREKASGGAWSRLSETAAGRCWLRLRGAARWASMADSRLKIAPASICQEGSRGRFSAPIRRRRSWEATPPPVAPQDHPPEGLRPHSLNRCPTTGSNTAGRDEGRIARTRPRPPHRRYRDRTDLVIAGGVSLGPPPRIRRKGPLFDSARRPAHPRG